MSILAQYNLIMHWRHIRIAIHKFYRSNRDCWVPSPGYRLNVLRWHFLYIKKKLWFNWILTCIKDTSKNPALAIADWLLRALVFQQDVNTSGPGWWGDTISVGIVPGANDDAFIVLGVDLNETMTGEEDPRSFRRVRSRLWLWASWG